MCDGLFIRYYRLSKEINFDTNQYSFWLLIPTWYIYNSQLSGNYLTLYHNGIVDGKKGNYLVFPSEISFSLPINENKNNADKDNEFEK